MGHFCPLQVLVSSSCPAQRCPFSYTLQILVFVWTPDPQSLEQAESSLHGCHSGHWTGLHDCVIISVPTHGLPLFEGGGLVHVLFRILRPRNSFTVIIPFSVNNALNYFLKCFEYIPFPQVWEHADSSAHSLQLPSE